MHAQQHPDMSRSPGSTVCPHPTLAMPPSTPGTQTTYYTSHYQDLGSDYTSSTQLIV